MGWPWFLLCFLALWLIFSRNKSMPGWEDKKVSIGLVIAIILALYPTINFAIKTSERLATLENEVKHLSRSRAYDDQARELLSRMQESAKPEERAGIKEWENLLFTDPRAFSRRIPTAQQYAAEIKSLEQLKKSLREHNASKPQH